MLRQAQHRAGIDAATEIGRDLDIGDQSLSNGIEQSLAEVCDDLGFTSRISSHLFGRWDLPIPIRIDANVAVPGDRVTTRRDGADPRELGLFVRSAYTSCCSLQIPSGWHTHRQQRLDLRCEEHLAIHDRVVEGLDAEAIADRNHRLLAFIGNDHCKLTAQLACSLHASFVVQMQGDFAIALGREPIAACTQARRTFLAAGERPGSIAATAVFSPRELVIAPGAVGTADVTLTMPPGSSIRGVAAIFRGQTVVGNQRGVAMTASLGSLITFSISGETRIEAGAPEVSDQTETSNLAVTEWVTNVGAEPVVAGGAAALLNEAGTLVGKVPVEPQRLMPGERLAFKAEYPALLAPGAIAPFSHWNTMTMREKCSRALRNSPCRRLATIVAVLIVLAIASSDVAAQSLTLDYQQVATRPVPGATAAMSLDPSRVAASVQDGVVTLIGRGPGSTNVIVIAGDETVTLRVLVGEPPVVVLPGMRSVGAQNGSTGYYEARYGSDPGIFQGVLFVSRRDGDRTAELTLGGAAPFGNEIGSPVQHPSGDVHGALAQPGDHAARSRHLELAADHFPIQRSRAVSA